MTHPSLARAGRRALFFVLALTFSLFAAGSALAQPPGPPTPGPQPGAGDPLAEHLFPPDLVMRHQAEIGLSPAQRDALIEELQATQVEIVPLQFDVTEAAEALAGLLSEARIDEGQALAGAQRVMELEARAKARHLILLVRVKNLLTPEQQERLEAIRDRGAR